MSIERIDKGKIEIDVTVSKATVLTLSLLIRYILDGSRFFTTDHLQNMLTRFILAVMYLGIKSK